LGRRLVVRLAGVAMEAMTGARVDHDVRWDRRVLGRVAHRFDLVDRNRLIVFAEQSEPRGLQLRRELGQGRHAEPSGGTTAAVERPAGTQRMAGGGEYDDAATHAEPDDADLLT